MTRYDESVHGRQRPLPAGGTVARCRACGLTFDTRNGGEAAAWMDHDRDCYRGGR